MDKAKMMEAIMDAAKAAAYHQKKPLDVGDLFFTLAFRTDDELRSMCRQMRIL